MMQLYMVSCMTGTLVTMIFSALIPNLYRPALAQLELIARALTSHRGGQAWVMRRRTQAEMDQLVEEAGFEKIEQRIDEWGIFTVSLARKKA